MAREELVGIHTSRKCDIYDEKNVSFLGLFELSVPLGSCSPFLPYRRELSVRWLRKIRSG